MKYLFAAGLFILMLVPASYGETTVDLVSCSQTTFYRTTTKHFTAVPVTFGDQEEWRSIYFLNFGSLVAGTTITVLAEGQMENNLGYNVELAQVLSLVDVVSGGTEPLTGKLISPVNGWNITPAAHYGHWVKVATHVLALDMSPAYLVARLRARSTGARPGDVLIVSSYEIDGEEFEQGFMSAIICEP